MLVTFLVAISVLAAIGAVVTVVIGSRKLRASSNDSADRDGAGTGTTSDAHTYDPKDGLLIVTGTENPAVAVPSGLSAAERKVVDNYLRLGKDLGLAISYFPHGASVNAAFMDEFVEAEKRYAALGFRPISLHAFEGLGGWNKPLPPNEQACVRREPNEEAKLFGPDTKARLQSLGRLY